MLYPDLLGIVALAVIVPQQHKSQAQMSPSRHGGCQGESQRQTWVRIGMLSARAQASDKSGRAR